MIGSMHGVPKRNLEAFFGSMVLYDVSMPHSHLCLSPITYNEFAIRNQFITISPCDTYEMANAYYAEKIRLMGDHFLSESHKICNFDKIHEKGEGWNPLISWLLKLEYLKEVPYANMQMHYIAHICYQAQKEFAAEKDSEIGVAVRTLFTDVVSPILYDPLIPVNYAFLPVMNFMDARFSDRIPILLNKVSAFIDRHKGMGNVKDLDKQFCQFLQKEAENTITQICQKKDGEYQTWAEMISQFVAKAYILESDIKMHECYP